MKRFLLVFICLVLITNNALAQGSFELNGVYTKANFSNLDFNDCFNTKEARQSIASLMILDYFTESLSYEFNVLDLNQCVVFAQDSEQIFAIYSFNNNYVLLICYDIPLNYLNISIVDSSLSYENSNQYINAIIQDSTYTSYSVKPSNILKFLDGNY